MTDTQQNLPHKPLYIYITLAFKQRHQRRSTIVLSSFAEDRNLGHFVVGINVFLPVDTVP